MIDTTQIPITGNEDQRKIRDSQQSMGKYLGTPCSFLFYLGLSTERLELD